MFDLKKYLANNPLLNEGLSNQEQDIVDDILSVTEGVNDIINKLKNYAKKGLLTAAIISSVVGQLQAQNQDKIANQISTELSSELKNIPPAYGKIANNIPNRITYGKVLMASEEGKTFTEEYPRLEWDEVVFPVKSVNINGNTYQPKVYEIADQEGLYKYEFTRQGIVDPYLSFYALTKAQPSSKNLIDKNPNSLNSNKPLPSLVSSYVEKGYRIIDSYEETVSGDEYKVVYMTDTPPTKYIDIDLYDFVGIWSKNNIVYSEKRM